MARDSNASQKKPSDRTPGANRNADAASSAAEKNRTLDNASDASRSVSTDDPIVRSEGDRLRNPAASFSLETNQASAGEPAAPPPGSATAARDVVERSSPSSREDRLESARDDAGPRTQDASAESDDPRADEPWRQDEPRHEGWSWKSLALTAVVALICGAAGAWAYAKFLGSSKHDEQNGKQHAQGGQSGKSHSSGSKKSSGKQHSEGGGSSRETGSDDSASEIPGFTSADDAETLKKQIKHLSDRLDLMHERMEKMKAPENETPPVLHTLQTQVSELAKTLDETAKLPAQVRHLDRRLSSLIEQFKTLRDEVAPEKTSADSTPAKELPSDSLKTHSAGSDSSTNSSTKEEQPAASNGEDEADVNDDDATFDLAAALFKAGRYAQARDVFRRLQQARPHDARVWYFSAVANGLITHAWDGETKRLFERGVARERAGTPAQAEIDEALATEMPADARRQLDEYRRQVTTDKASQTTGDGKQPSRLNNDSLKVP